METTRGSVWALRIGWLGTLTGALLLLVVIGQHVAATHGSGVGYDPDPPAQGYHGWGMVVSVFGPLVGFNLVYFGAPAAHRQRHLAAFLAVVLLQVAALTAATLWAVGAGLPAGIVTADVSSGAEAVVVPLTFLGSPPSQPRSCPGWVGARTSTGAAGSTSAGAVRQWRCGRRRCGRGWPPSGRWR
ncbi:hypothetical protein G5V58_00565 [Nocardioides anomalus]|uniref:Uncharacterized protein n=1 Tax=Nocardioides anomalus TaxID=2712223 RepID=A0A6G6W8N0_9ACTN|nr:hypothetical protein [Nocardioides anomalus]QIG41465.1 hypothetical protein G5V58_00565 [Nocardioides anomalus]